MNSDTLILTLTSYNYINIKQNASWTSINISPGKIYLFVTLKSCKIISQNMKCVTWVNRQHTCCRQNTSKPREKLSYPRKTKAISTIKSNSRVASSCCLLEWTKAYQHLHLSQECKYSPRTEVVQWWLEPAAEAKHLSQLMIEAPNSSAFLLS